LLAGKDHRPDRPFPEEAQQAEAAGRIIWRLSDIYHTNQRRCRPAAGTQLIQQIKRAVKIPLVAIGGINLANAPEVIRAGADGLCAISAVVCRENIRAEIEKYQRLFRRFETPEPKPCDGPASNRGCPAPGRISKRHESLLPR